MHSKICHFGIRIIFELKTVKKQIQGKLSVFPHLPKSRTKFCKYLFLLPERAEFLMNRKTLDSISPEVDTKKNLHNKSY